MPYPRLRRSCSLAVGLSLLAACQDVQPPSTDRSGAASAAGGAAAASDSDTPSGTVVIVHGAWGGAWDWRETADSLEAMGYTVHRVTLTGLGERSHLRSADVDLSTHVTDVVNVLQWEELENVILVGHSYGGMVITGAAEAVPERIRRLVYFDAMLPMDGECVLAARAGRGSGEGCGPEALDEALGMTVVDGAVPAGWAPEEAPVPKDVPHPVGTLTEPLQLAGEPGNGRPVIYIITREQAGGEDDFNAFAERAGALGWPVVEYVGDHVPYREDPGGIARLFVAPDRH